jgi:hypothetical protein
MKTKDELDQYTKLIKDFTTAQTKATNVLDKALNRLTEEERKYKEFNDSGFMKYKAIWIPVCTTVATLLVLGFVAFIFVSTGHPITFKSGTNQIQSK